MSLKEEKFKNEPSKKLYQALTELIDAKRLTPKDVATKFGKYEATPRNYFNAVSSAKISVTVEQILKAQEFFGIDPCKLFTCSGNESSSKTMESENNWILNEEEEKFLTKGDSRSKDLIRIIEKQQETIHFLITGKNGDTIRKKAS